MVEIKYTKIAKGAYIPEKSARALSRTVIPPFKTIKMRIGIMVDVPKGYELGFHNSDNLLLNKGLEVPYGTYSVKSNNDKEVVILIRNVDPRTKLIEAGEIIANFTVRKVEEFRFVNSEAPTSKAKKTPEVKE